MDLSISDKVLWAVGFLGNLALLCTLIGRGRTRTFPIFTGYIAFQVLTTAVLFLNYSLVAARGYTRLYWATAALDFCLLLSLLTSIAAQVLRPTSHWAEGSKSRIGLLSILAIVLAGLVSFLVRSNDLHSLDVWEDRANLFTSILTCEIFTAILLTSQRLGLHWRSHLMQLGYGLTIWALMCFVTDGLHAALGPVRYFHTLEHVRMVAYVFTVFYWTFCFYRDEPERERATPEMREKVLQVTERLRYDLAKALTARERESR